MLALCVKLVVSKMLTRGSRQEAMRLGFIVISEQSGGIIWHDNKWGVTETT